MSHYKKISPWIDDVSINFGWNNDDGYWIKENFSERFEVPVVETTESNDGYAKVLYVLYFYNVAVDSIETVEWPSKEDPMEYWYCKGKAFSFMVHSTKLSLGLAIENASIPVDDIVDTHIATTEELGRHVLAGYKILTYVNGLGVWR